MPPIPPVSYTSKDYDSFVSTMLDAIPDRLPEWRSRSPSDPGIVLIELFAYVGDVLSYYGDRVANEAFLTSASLRRSVLDHASQMDYTPTGNLAATTTLLINVDTSEGGVTIPAGTRVSTSSELATEQGEEPVYFTTNETVAAPAGTTSVEVEVTEGELIVGEELGYSNGRPGQTFTLFETPVVDGSVSILVEEVEGTFTEWNLVANLLEAESADRVFSVSTDENGFVQVRFGDNSSGRIPPLEANIYANYRVGGGERGNVAAYTIVDVHDTISEIQSITNPEPAVGGTDVESIDLIKQRAPRSLRSLNRAVTTEDYANLALQVRGVGKAYAEASIYTSVNLYVAPSGSRAGTLNDQIKTDVLDYLESRKMIGVTVTLMDPIYVPIEVEVDILVRDEFHQATVVDTVRRAIASAVDYSEVDFGHRVSLASIYRALDTVDGLQYGVISLLRLESETDPLVEDIVIDPDSIPVISDENIVINAEGGVVS